MRYAIDLIWVKPGNVGGAESYIRNLLFGIAENKPDDEIFLIVTRDNAHTFRHYLSYPCYKIITCPINSYPVSKRILWQNLNFEKILLSNGINKCFCPFYCKPLRKSKRVEYVTVIHDLQQLHYPEYFSKKRYYWIRFAWKRSIETSKKIIAISDFDKEDIMHWYHVPSDKVIRIYNPIVIDNGIVDFEYVKRKYEIGQYNYYFALSSMLKHKNLETLLKLIERIKEENDKTIPSKLIISGIGGPAKNEIEAYIKSKHLEKDCILTGFISNEERNTLYTNSYAFLFPSIFEGFGMPVVEGLMFGTNVITTKKTSIPEVSKGLAVYVDDPYNVDEWIMRIKQLSKSNRKKYQFPEYDKVVIASKYLNVLHREFGGIE